MDRPPAAKPVLQKPPGFRDPATPPAAAPKPPPPRAAQLPPTFQQVGKPPRRRRRRSCCCRLCCCLFILVLVLLLLAGAVAGAVYLWFQPQLPSFRLQSLKIPEFKISARDNGTVIDAVTAVAVQASNPNRKIELTYTVIEARISAGDDDGDVGIGTGWVPGFAQEAEGERVLRFSTSAKGVLVDDATGSRLRDRSKSRDVRFAVEIRTTLAIRVGGQMARRVPFRVSCGPVSQAQAEQGGKCKVDLFIWLAEWEIPDDF